MPLFTQHSPQVLVITPQAEGSYSFPQAAFFSKISFSQQQKAKKKTMIFFMKIESENMMKTCRIGYFYFV